MSHRGPSLSDLELRYPFIPRSRKFFESIPVEEGLTSREVVSQTQARLMNALGRAPYEPHISELIEFSTFFAAALVAGQDDFLVSRFARREAERAKAFFLKEGSASKTTVMSECFGMPLELPDDGGGRRFSARFEDYLGLVSRYDLAKEPRWKLARQALEKGTVYLSDNLLNDLFADCAGKAVADGTRNLRKAAFPKQLTEVRDAVMRYVPVRKAKPSKGYLYVEDLLKHPVADGRHRLVWMVLAPYLVNVKKLEDDEAIERIRGFVSVAGETRDMKRFIEYNVRRARRNGLLPPTLATLKSEHPDIYSLLPREALVSEVPPRGKDGRAKA